MAQYELSIGVVLGRPPTKIIFELKFKIFQKMKEKKKSRRRYHKTFTAVIPYNNKLDSHFPTSLTFKAKAWAYR